MEDFFVWEVEVGGGEGLLVGLDPVCENLRAGGNVFCVWFMPTRVGGAPYDLKQLSRVLCRWSCLL